MNRKPKSSVGEMIGRRQYEAVVTTVILLDQIIEESKLHQGHGSDCPFANEETMKEVRVAIKILEEARIAYKIHEQSQRFSKN